MDASIKFKSGTEIVPVQIFLEKEYKLYKGERYFSRGFKRLHRVVWEHYNGKIPKGYDIHHVDGDTTNNDIKNLNLVSRSLHARYSGKKRFAENKEWFEKFHKKGIEKAKDWHKSEEGRKWHVEHGKKAWRNREYRPLNCQVCGKEYFTRHGGVSKYCHNNCKAKALRARRREEGNSL